MISLGFYVNLLSLTLSLLLHRLFIYCMSLPGTWFAYQLFSTSFSFGYLSDVHQYYNTTCTVRTHSFLYMISYIKNTDRNQYFYSYVQPYYS